MFYNCGEERCRSAEESPLPTLYRRALGGAFDMLPPVLHRFHDRPNGGCARGVGRVTWGMSKDRNFLVCKLPSGRYLRYFRPAVKTEPGRNGEPKSVLYYWTSASEGAIKTDCNGYLGLYKTWGGELVENVVQAIARDVLVCGLLKAEEMALPVVLHAHDELVAEIKSSDSANLSTALTMYMTEGLPAWAAGLPVAAEGWIGRRYRK